MEEKSRPITLSLIIPVFNAGNFLADTVRRIGEWAKVAPYSVEVIFINDGSADNSAAILQHAAECGFVVVNSARNKGKGFAVREGLKIARGEFVTYTDADLPYGLDVLGAMVKALGAEPGLALLYGSRSHAASVYKSGYSMVRRLGRAFFSVAIRLLAVRDVPDTQSGLKMMRRNLAQFAARKLIVNRFAFDVELFVLAKANGLRYKDFPVVLDQPKESSVHLVKDTLWMLWDVVGIRTRAIRGFYRT